MGSELGDKRSKRQRATVKGLMSPTMGDRLLPSHVRVFLQELHADAVGRILPITTARTVIGRGGADIELDDPRLSRKHAAIEVWSAQRIVLRDLASRNGTYLNDRLVESQAPIEMGDVIRVGRIRLRLVVDLMLGANGTDAGA